MSQQYILIVLCLGVISMHSMDTPENSLDTPISLEYIHEPTLVALDPEHGRTQLMQAAQDNDEIRCRTLLSTYSLAQLAMQSLEEKKSPLMYAAEYAGQSILANMLARVPHEPLINLNCKKGRTALMYALRARRSDNASLLLAYGACVHKRDCKERDALAYAVDFCPELIPDIFQKYDPITMFSQLYALLKQLLLVHSESFSLIIGLLDKRLDLSDMRQSLLSKLLCDVLRASNRSVFDQEALHILLRSGADPDRPDDETYPVSLAIDTYNTKLISFLVSRGMELNICDEQGNTPLINLMRSHIFLPVASDFLMFLIFLGADPYKTNKLGETIFSFFAPYSNFVLLLQKKIKRIVKDLQRGTCYGIPMEQMVRDSIARLTGQPEISVIAVKERLRDCMRRMEKTGHKHHIPLQQMAGYQILSDNKNIVLAFDKERRFIVRHAIDSFLNNAT